MSLRAIAGAFVVLVVLLDHVPARAADDDAVFVSGLAQRTIDVLLSTRSQAEREAKFHELVDEAFDVPAIARFVLGPYWRTATDAQREEFQKLFETYIVHVSAVRFGGYSAGTVVIKTSERRLYYVTGDGEAVRYRVGVGKGGMAWAGTTSIDGKYIRPAWSAPESIRKDYTKLPSVVPGGSPSNPMGAAALTLSGGGQYAIHGTNNPGSVGGFVSHGCFRMYNEDIMDLYARVSVGTTVVVLR